MFKSTFHSHSAYDDGREGLEDYILSAVSKSFSAFGFSGHAPVPFFTGWNMKEEDLPRYMEEAKGLKAKYGSQIDIYTGLEADFYPGCQDYRKVSGMNYTIGAVHFIHHPESGRYLALDGSRQEFEETMNLLYRGKIRGLVEDYYGLLREMLLKMPPAILAHMDIIRKNNGEGRYFTEEEPWYREAVLNTLEILSLSQTVLEVNTGGMARGYTKTPYPSPWILKQCLEMGIPIMVNSDTHHPDTVDYYYSETYELLKFIGFKSQRVLYRGKWCDVPL